MNAMKTIADLSAEERQMALEKAAAVRKARAEIRRKLKERELSPRDALNEEDAQGIRAELFIRACPGIGKTKTEAIMHECGIAANRRVKGLGARQREKLVELIEKAGYSGTVNL